MVVHQAVRAIELRFPCPEPFTPRAERQLQPVVDCRLKLRLSARNELLAQDAEAHCVIEPIVDNGAIVR